MTTPALAPSTQLRYDRRDRQRQRVNRHVPATALEVFEATRHISAPVYGAGIEVEWLGRYRGVTGQPNEDGTLTVKVVDMIGPNGVWLNAAPVEVYPR